MIFAGTKKSNKKIISAARKAKFMDVTFRTTTQHAKPTYINT